MPDIRLLVVSPSVFICAGIAHIAGVEWGSASATRATSLSEALVLTTTQRPTLIVVDGDLLHDLDGAQLTRFKAAAHGARVLLLESFPPKPARSKWGGRQGLPTLDRCSSAKRLAVALRASHDHRAG